MGSKAAGVDSKVLLAECYFRAQGRLSLLRATRRGTLLAGLLHTPVNRLFRSGKLCSEAVVCHCLDKYGQCFPTINSVQRVSPQEEIVAVEEDVQVRPQILFPITYVGMVRRKDNKLVHYGWGNEKLYLQAGMHQNH